MSAERMVYSIQQTYILTHVLTPEREIVTCNQRIDIPTIEPLPNVQAISPVDQPITVIPCIELAGAFLSEFDLTFETNEGVTVLPIAIYPGSYEPIGNPYMHFRYVLVLPRGATGVKSCKLIHKATGKEVQHNFTFGIMPPPYNYDNMLFGYTISTMLDLFSEIASKIRELKLVSSTSLFSTKKLPKGNGTQLINIKTDMLYFTTVFSYPPSSEATVHHPRIEVQGDSHSYEYTLSLNKVSQTVTIDLLMGMITVYDSRTGEIMQQFKLPVTLYGFDIIRFKDFDDIEDNTLNVVIRGRRVE